MGVCGVLSVGDEWLFGLKACLALEKISFALATLLLLRFFSVDETLVASVEPLRSGEVRSTVESMLFADAEAEEGDVGLAMVVSASFLLVAGPELPNILVSRPPPWPEKLRLFGAASLKFFDCFGKCCEA
jgi:hypothetical protein